MKDFVPYEESLELEKLDFDTELIFAKWIWDEGPELMIKGKKYMWTESEIKSGKIKHCKAPTFSQAFRFFRDKGFDVEIVIYHFHGKYVGKKFKYLIYKFDEDKIKNSANISDGEFEILLSMINPDNSQDSYEEAELACLRKLIQIVKDEQ